MAAKKKLTAEAGLSEVKMILGWRQDLHQLNISLPFNKFTPSQRKSWT
jgi:hypothetical protein